MIRKQLKKGLFFVIEGVDGAGKSTQIKHIADWLIQIGYDTVITREPTSESTFGRAIRERMHGERVSPDDELTLFMNDRMEHIRNLIKPALDEKKIVICDRYYYSNIAYQGAAGLDPDDIRRKNEAFAIIPDAVFYLRLPPIDGLDRIKNFRDSELTSFEKVDYLIKVSAIFDTMDFSYFHTIDAALSKEEVLQQIVEYIKEIITKHE